MTDKHTPGPWTLYRSERFAEYYVNQRGGPGYVGTMPLYEHRLAECEANARLVAAAPDLLAALREVLAFQSAKDAPTIHDWGRWRRIADAAGAEK